MLRREDGPPGKTSLSFDPTINAGHILTFVAMMITVFFTWATLDKRVVVLEEAKVYQRQRDDAQDDAIRGQLNEIKEAMREIRAGILDLQRQQQQARRP